MHGFQPITLSKNTTELQRFRKGAMLMVIYRAATVLCQASPWQQLVRLLRSLVEDAPVCIAFDMFGGVSI